MDVFKCPCQISDPAVRCSRSVRKCCSFLRAKAPWLLLYPQNPVLCGFGKGWNLDLLLRLGIKTHARFPLLLHQLAKTGQDKFAGLFNLFIGERAQSIQEYSRGFFVSLGGFGKYTLEFGLGHFVAVGYAGDRSPMRTPLPGTCLV
jgi:hypothetical protein